LIKGYCSYVNTIANKENDNPLNAVVSSTFLKHGEKAEKLTLKFHKKAIML